MEVIGISGKAESGKTTFSNFLKIFPKSRKIFKKNPKIKKN